MPRQVRLILPDVALHVVQRGNNRSRCFRRDSDRQLYLLHLRELAGKLACRVHAYCLMTNHVHLLLTPPSADAGASLMRNLGQRYVQYFNRTYGRTGTLWDGRFRSFLAESSRYVLACYRYIELNPVRAGMTDDPAEYRWSSFRTNAGGEADALVEPHPEFEALGNYPAARRAAYVELVRQGLEPSLLRIVRQSTQSGYPLVGEAFKAALKRIPGYRTEPGRPGPAGRKSSGSDPELGI